MSRRRTNRKKTKKNKRKQEGGGKPGRKQTENGTGDGRAADREQRRYNCGNAEKAVTEVTLWAAACGDSVKAAVLRIVVTAECRRIAATIAALQKR